MAGYTYNTIIDNKYKIGSMIGKQLIALDKNIAFFDHVNSKAIQVFEKGSTLGTVINYYIPPGKNQVYWYFKDRNNRSYFILHDVKKVGLNAIDKATTKTVTDYIEEKKTDQEIEEKGKFVYYFERYGKIILFTSAVALVGYAWITKKPDTK